MTKPVVFLIAAWMVFAAEGSGPFSEAQALHGKELFGARCAACHGDRLEGGDHAPSLKNDRFWADWNGQNARALYRWVTTKMADTPGGLDGQNGIDLVAFILSENGIRGGAKTLNRVDDLDGIRLERPK